MPPDVVLIVRAGGLKDSQDDDNAQQDGSQQVGILIKRTRPNQAFELNSAAWAGIFDNDFILPYTVLLAVYLSWMLTWPPGGAQEHFSAMEVKRGAGAAATIVEM